MGNLVLRRRVGEQIVIGERIILTVVSVEGERVKLGISAPEDVSIVRRELLDDAAIAGHLPARFEGKGDA